MDDTARCSQLRVIHCGRPGRPIPWETKRSAAGASCTTEVYPHPALLHLLGRDYRVPYKVSKAGKYWKGTSVATRIENLSAEFAAIEGALAAEFGPTGVDIPEPPTASTLTALKRYEDALDSLVCAWAGKCFLEGRARAFGDDHAAIWVPTDR